MKTSTKLWLTGLIIGMGSVSFLAHLSHRTLPKIGYGGLGLGLIAGYSLVQKRARDEIAEELNQIIDNLHKALSEQENKTAEGEFDLEVKQNEIVDLTSQLDLKIKEHQDAIGTVSQEFKVELQTKLKAMADIYQESLDEKDGEILKLRQDIQKALDYATSLKTDYDARVNDLAEDRKRFESQMREKELNHQQAILTANQITFTKSKEETERLFALEKTLKNKEIELENERTDFEAQKLNFRDQINTLSQSNETLQSERELLYHQNAELKTALNELNGEWNPASLENQIINKLRAYYRGHGIGTRFINVIEKTQNRITLKFDCAEDKKDEIIKLDKATSNDIFDGKPVKLRRADGYVAIDIPFIKQGSVQLETKEFEPGYVNVEYLKNFILNSNHFLIGGGTGDGKTTLVSNVIDLCGELLQNPEIILINPKPTATKFTFKGDIIKPQYMNLSQPGGCSTPDCAEGLADMKTLLETRMSQAQMALERDEEFPEFDPVLIVVDEVPTLRDAYKDDFSSVVKLLSRMGREYNLIAICIGQGATVREWGLDTRSQVQNFSRVYLKSILNTKVVEDNEIKYLPNRDAVNQLIEDYKSYDSGKLDAHGYYGLFIPQGSKAGEMSYLPSPNFFFQNQPKIECPNCGSHDVTKSGILETKSGVKQRYDCHNCSLRFSVD